MPRITVAIVLIVLTGAVTVFFTVPQWEAIQAGRTAVGELEALSAELIELAARRDELTDAYNRIPEADLLKLQAVAPAERGTAEALTDFEALAIQNNIALDQIDFVAGEKSAVALGAPGPRPYAAVPVNISLRANYESFRNFLTALEYNLRLFEVEEITFASAQGREGPIALRGSMFVSKR